MPRTVRRFLKTIPRQGVTREVAFFGGTFTALPTATQKRYLSAVAPFIAKGLIDGIRISTRPDAVDQSILDTLKRYHVTTVELGVQSLADDVLRAADRGYTAAQVVKASRLILDNGFTLGHQLMVGLPGSTAAKELTTARASIAMGAREVRIYPVVVIKATRLAAMWRKGLYKALGEKTAVRRSAALVDLFRKADVKVLRCGLHPSPGLLTGKEILAGPFHEAFGQKVETYRWGKIVKELLLRKRGSLSTIRIRMNPADAGSIIGHGRVNAAFVESLLGRRDVFVYDASVSPGTIAVA